MCHVGASYPDLCHIILFFFFFFLTGNRIVMPFIVTACGKTRSCDSMCYGGVKAGRPLCWSTDYIFPLCWEEPYKRKKIENSGTG